MRSSDSCRAIAFRPFVLRATVNAEPDRPRWVRPADFAPIPSPLRPHHQRRSGFVAAR
jgi:hypothetical protein